MLVDCEVRGMSSVLVDQVLRGSWVGTTTRMVRYGRAGYGYGMVWQGMGMVWYGLVCGTVLFGTEWYGRVPVWSGMWYDIFSVSYTHLTLPTIYSV